MFRGGAQRLDGDPKIQPEDELKQRQGKKHID